MARGDEAGADEDRFARRLIDGVRSGLALLDGAGRIQIANRAAEELLGYGPGELAGRPLDDLYTREELAAGALAAALKDGRTEDEDVRPRGDGSRVRARFALGVLPATDGGAVAAAPGFALELHEVTSRPDVEADLRARLAHEAEARQRAEEAGRARDEFLATLSHELRTPLTAIMGWAHLLRTGSLDEAGRARALETIERNAHVEAQLTAEILDVARIITGKLELHIQSVDPREVVEAAVETVRQEAETGRIHLRVDVEGDPPPVSGDPDRLQQVVANLLTNAIKFTPEGGAVDVRVASGDGGVEIEVKDTGDGISPEVLPHVFERFRQGGGHAYGKGGLGLGLAIVHHIVELHSGHVRASSEGPGRGSSFVVQLPAAADRPAPVAQPPAPPPAAGPADPPPLKDVTVLVVDDQDDARELMCAVLGRRGAHVVAVDSTAAALEALDRLRPDVMLSDLEMPGEDGYSLIRKVRELPPERGGTVPAAALTAYARTEDRLHSLRAGFHRHVPKPVQPDELAEIVASLAGRRRG
jgi:PAS domain S-box-containing protein